MEDNEYNAWFDGACGPVNPGGTATYGIMVKDQMVSATWSTGATRARVLAGGRGWWSFPD